MIVLDLEPEQTEARRDPPAIFCRGHEPEPANLIVLGKIRRGPVFTGGHVISKPYHFAPLIHTIEQLAAKAA